MAIVTTPLAKGPDVALTVTEDFTGDPETTTGDLIQFDLVCTVPVHITLYRKATGNPWRDATVQPGSYTYESGGPVQSLDDLERIEVGW